MPAEPVHVVNHLQSDTDMEPIVNKVAKSGLITIDLQQFEPADEIIAFDLKDFLYMELILKEKDFREALDNIDWPEFQDKTIAVFCSTDAIIAQWAYMLVAAHATGIARKLVFGTPNAVREKIFVSNTEAHDWQQYNGKRVLLKGCSDREIPPSVYMTATTCLQSVAERIMYGEACSFVPVFRRKKTAQQANA